MRVVPDPPFANEATGQSINAPQQADAGAARVNFAKNAPKKAIPLKSLTSWWRKIRDWWLLYYTELHKQFVV